ncbi:MAG: mechanosensitive ion channel family protein [Pseudomonadota bacterium]
MARILLCISLFLTIACGSAGAQVLDYRALMGGGGSEPEASQQSLPFSPAPFTSGPEQGPTATDYATLTQPSGPMLGAAKNAVEVFRERLIRTLSHLPRTGGEIWGTLQAASPTGRSGYFVGTMLFAILLLMVGRAVSRLFDAFIARPIFVGLQRPNPKGYRDKLPVLCSRILITIFSILLTIGVASAVGLYFYQQHEPTLLTVIALFVAYGTIRAIEGIWRMALAPFLPAYRLPVIEDRPSRRLYRWLVAASAVGILVFALTAWLTALGLPQKSIVLVTILGNITVVVTLILMLRVNRSAITALIFSGRSPDEASWVTLAASRLWSPLSVLYLIAALGKLTFDLIMGIETRGEELIVPYLVLLIGLIAYAATSYVIERVFTQRRAIAEENARAAAARAAEDAAAEAERQAEPGFGASGDIDGDGDEESATKAEVSPALFRPGASMRSFEDLARRVASLFAIGAGAWALLYYWGGIGLFAENAFIGMTEDLIDILFIGYITYHAARIWIDQKIEEEGVDESDSGPLDGEGGGAGATRLATLLPLIRNFVLGVILIAIVLVAATELGVNVAPLFAGAGIVGLAIGFGSQALVRDILSGAFFLMDDAFRKGEYIDVGEVKGTVEKISIRSFQLRHHLGMLHTIPFGEIQHLTNFSRDWVMMKLPLRVTYDTDVERVRKLIKKLGQQLMDDPVVGPNFLQPLKSQGVIHMDDSAMIIRVKFMTKPGDQWVVRKRVYQEIRELFDREGIKFAHREVTVRIPDLPQDRPPNEAEIKAIGAAARRVGDTQAEEMLATGTGGPLDDR